MSANTRITVTAERTYDVVIGRHLLAELPQLVGPEVRKILIVHTEALEATATAVRLDLLEQGYETLLAVIPDAEEAKHVQVLTFAWQILGQADFTRSDAIVSIGGGATTDVAGFIAATWLRGIKVVHIPTTLLAMVDAGVGGKTGINTAEGKNLVGAFYSPAGVLCDLAALETLPKWDFVAGLAEVIKTGFIADPVILDLVEANAAALQNWPDSAPQLWDVVQELIERSIAARLAGKLDESVVERMRSILSSVGLPITYRGDKWEQLLSAMRRDKKTRGDMLRFVILEGVGKPVRLEGPDPMLLVSAYAEVSAPAPKPGGPILL